MTARLRPGGVLLVPGLGPRPPARGNRRRRAGGAAECGRSPMAGAGARSARGPDRPVGAALEGRGRRARQDLAGPRWPSGVSGRAARRPGDARRGRRRRAPRRSGREMAAASGPRSARWSSSARRGMFSGRERSRSGSFWARRSTGSGAPARRRSRASRLPRWRSRRRSLPGGRAGWPRRRWSATRRARAGGARAAQGSWARRSSAIAAFAAAAKATGTRLSPLEILGAGAADPVRDADVGSAWRAGAGAKAPPPPWSRRRGRRPRPARRRGGHREPHPGFEPAVPHMARSRSEALAIAAGALNPSR